MMQAPKSRTYRILYIPILLLFFLAFTDCAKKGRPSGGVKDSIPPVIVRSVPENFTTNFNEDDIRISFDEYIKLKDVTKELLISPPLKYPPVITPTNVSKQLRIKILDTLRENTTYSFSFGNSIVDNNEGNIFPNYKYVFSTGSYIDSLTLKGTVTDALLAEPQNPSTVLLYEINDTYNDSLIFTDKPIYLTTTQGETSNFEFTNLKAGTYQLIALKESSNNYTFQPEQDKIAYYPELITLPTDSTFELKLFKEIPDFKANRPKLESKNRISVGYKGIGDSLKVNFLTEMPQDFEYILLKERGKDTLNVWFKPQITLDSVQLVTANQSIRDTTVLKLRELYADSLQVTSINAGKVSVKDTFAFAINTPLVAIDKEKISVIDNDTIATPFTVLQNSELNAASIWFDKVEEKSYNITALKGALTDFYGNVNDSIVGRQQIQSASDFATLQLTLTNANQFPLLIQLVNEKFEIKQSKHLESLAPIIFENIKPGNYFVRVIYDGNNNKKWDTGNFLKRTAPEKVIYYPAKIELRANWSWNESFILE